MLNVLIAMVQGWRSESMKCCLCKNEIEAVRGWAEGNNAEPVMDGRCCDDCNMSRVIPARLKQLNGGSRQ